MSDTMAFIVSQLLKEYDINNRSIEVISSLYNEATSAVALKRNVRDRFFERQFTRRMSIISCTLKYIHGKDHAKDFDTSTSIRGQPVCNLQFIVDIDLLEGSKEEL